MRKIVLGKGNYRIEYDPNDKTNYRIMHGKNDHTTCTKSGPNANLINELVKELIAIDRVKDIVF